MRTNQRLKRCLNCGEEIVATINDSEFRDGECGECEYGRYRRHAELLQTLITIRDTTESLDYEDDDVLGELKAKEEALDEIRDLAYEVINKNADYFLNRRKST